MKKRAPQPDHPGVRFRVVGGKRFFSLYNLQSNFARKKENPNHQKKTRKIVYNYPSAPMAALRAAMMSSRGMLGLPGSACSGSQGTWMKPTRVPVPAKWWESR